MHNIAETITITLDAHAIGLRADKALAAAAPQLSRERIKALILAGHVFHADGRAFTDPSRKIDTPMGLTLMVPDAEPSHNTPQDLPLNIAYEDANLIIIDKPAGMVVHPAAGNADGTLVNALLHHCAGQLSGIGGVARPGIVHRIDKDTSGLIVIAKDDSTHIGLAKQFAEHSIHRRYCAIVHGHPNPRSNSISTQIGRSNSNRKKMAVVPETSGKHAVTHYHTDTMLRDASLISCILETGRTHQIRVHMAHIGHALLGDPVYGSNRKRMTPLLHTLGFARQALHAAELGFIHPANGSEIRLSSALPADMVLLIDALRL